MGQTSILPLDNDPIALRHQIWLATDEAYKDAGQALTQKQAALKQFTADDHPVEDFAKVPVVTLVQPLATMKYDEGGWKKSLEDATNVYRTYPEIQSLSAFARFSLMNEYFVNSEGTVTRTGKNVYSVQLSASTQAPDGMRLARSPAWTVAKYEELPSREKLVQYSREALETLKALRTAPIVDEEYRGPVLFEADAADDVLAGLIGNNVLGRKPQLGAPNRTTGAFATSYKSRVLPSFMDVVDDPTMKEAASAAISLHALIRHQYQRRIMTSPTPAVSVSMYFHASPTEVMNCVTITASTMDTIVIARETAT